MSETSLTPAELLVRCRVDHATNASVVAADVGADAEALVAISVGGDRSQQVRLMGTNSSLHQLIIDLDRLLTRLGRTMALR